MNAMKTRLVILVLAVAAGAGAVGAQAPQAHASSAPAAAAPPVKGPDKLTIHGKTYTFDELDRLPKKQQDDLFENQMTDAQYAQWAAHMTQQTARLRRADQVMGELLAERDMKIVLTEEVKQKNRARAAIFQEVLRDEGLKRKLPAETYHVYEVVARALEKDGTVANLRKEDFAEPNPSAKKPAKPAK
jgi:hypothetical protein